MSLITITPEVKKALAEFKLPEEIGFGKIIAPVMIEADYANGAWGTLELKPYGPITLDPTAKVFHYAQEIFEGLKAYKTREAGPFLFRPKENAMRFNSSAKRMAMPDLPLEYFVEGTKTLTACCSDLIPLGTGETLYIRPFMFATEEHLGIKPSEKFKFLIIASPSGNYFKSGSVKVYIERKAVRATPGGCGIAKTGGNYAASLLSAKKANDRGCQQVLWLDALKQKEIEEMSGMNFMAIINDKLYTPALTDTILNGITRKSILDLAEDLGLETVETEIEIDWLISKMKSNECQEAFACGTAAILTPINTLQEEDGTEYSFSKPDGEVSLKLKERLLDMQEGRLEDKRNWIVKVDPISI